MHKKVIIVLVAICLFIDVLDFLEFKLKRVGIVKVIAASLAEEGTSYEENQSASSDPHVAFPMTINRSGKVLDTCPRACCNKCSCIHFRSHVR
jgi:hypothetical protein